MSIVISCVLSGVRFHGGWFNDSISRGSCPAPVAEEGDGDRPGCPATEVFVRTSFRSFASGEGGSSGGRARVSTRACGRRLGDENERSSSKCAEFAWEISRSGRMSG